MLRILYVIENLSFGGGERAFAQLINGLDKGKYEIYVICAARGEFTERIKASARILDFKLRNRFSLKVIFQLANIMKENKFQIVHSQGGRADFFTRIAAGLADVPVVVSTIAMSVEGYDVCLLRKIIYVILDRISERFVDKFIVVSEALRKRLVRIHRIPSDKVVKIYNGVEINQDTQWQISDIRKRLEQEFGIPNSAILIGAIGRLVWQKGLNYFIQAIKQILTNKQQLSEDIRFIIVGEGNKRKSLECMARKMGVEKSIIFTGFRNDADKILKALDILVLSSVLEGHPIVLLEAMAMGKPIVATNIEGINETIDNGITGILVSSRDSGALAGAIICLLKDRKKTQEMARACRLAVEKNFTVNQMVKNTECVYQNSLEIA